MENEREKSLRKELGRMARDSKPRGDSLLRLIKKLQRLQASAPNVSSAKSLSKERSELARAVVKYLDDTKSGSTTEDSASSSQANAVPRSPFQVTRAADVDPAEFAASQAELIFECAQCRTSYHQREDQCLKCGEMTFTPLVYFQRP